MAFTTLEEVGKLANTAMLKLPTFSDSGLI